MMRRLLTRPWFEAQSLAAVQVYLEQPLRKPLPDLEAKLLRGAVNLTMADSGTPIDAAFRFYAGYAETATALGRDLNEIGFGVALGRLGSLKDQLKFYDEHVAALKSVAALRDEQSPQ